MSLRNDIIMPNVIYGKGAKKIIQTEKHTRVSAAPFLAGDFFGKKFEGATALLAQTNKAEQHVRVHEDYGGNNF